MFHNYVYSFVMQIRYFIINININWWITTEVMCLSLVLNIWSHILQEEFVSTVMKVLCILQVPPKVDSVGQ